jgi:hypothetical protein
MPVWIGYYAKSGFWAWSDGSETSYYDASFAAQVLKQTSTETSTPLTSRLRTALRPTTAVRQTASTTITRSSQATTSGGRPQALITTTMKVTSSTSIPATTTSQPSRTTSARPRTTPLKASTGAMNSSTMMVSTGTVSTVIATNITAAEMQYELCVLFEGGKWSVSSCIFPAAFVCIMRSPSPASSAESSTVYTAGATTCKSCSAGQYTDQYSASSCFLCAAGKYSSAAAATDETVCVPCTPGTFSTAKGSDAKFENETCLKCPPGKYSDMNAMTVCKNCYEGTYSSIDGITGSSDCISCMAGKYGSLEGNTRCWDCASGKYSNATGLSSNELCLSCVPGKYLSSQGVVNEAGCDICGKGTYSSTLAASECSNCSAGTFADVQETTSCLSCQPAFYASALGSQFCIECEAGTYSDSYATVLCQACILGKYSGQGKSFCTSCDFGTYSSRSASSMCTLCHVGTYQTGICMTRITDCIPCELGYFSSGLGMKNCSQCEKGAFSSMDGALNCSLCEVGTYQTGISMVSKENCSTCDAGTIQTGIGMFSEEDCIFCSPGKFSPYVASIMCSFCERGTYQTGFGMKDVHDCLSCVAGTYQTGTGRVISLECMLCRAGTFATGVGLINSTECSLCGAGTYDTGTGMTSIESCVLCDEGKYQTGTGMRASADCTLCHEGSYLTGKGQITSSNCSLCGRGKYQTGLGQVHETTCRACSEGKFQTGTGMAYEINCTLCRPGTFQTGLQIDSERSCSLCGPGTYQTGLGMRLLANCLLCGQGKYQTGQGQTAENKCALCVPGTFGTGIGSIDLNDCSPCDYDTFNPRNGSGAPDSCQACPNGTSTQGRNGTSNINFCRCDQFHYAIETSSNLSNTDTSLNCQQCPVGALCGGASATCIFNSFFTCQPALKPEGNWTVSHDGTYVLTGCSAGYSLRSSEIEGSASLQQCKLCPIGYYIVHPNTDNCQECPLGGGPSELVATGQACSNSKHIVPGAMWTLVIDRYQLDFCPTGYHVSFNTTGDKMDWASQYCMPCESGFECVTPRCVNCKACEAGKYKETQATDPCVACDANTFNPSEGSVSRTDCLACPCLSTTQKQVGRSAQADCVCDAEYYKAISNGTAVCKTCPKGGVCMLDSSCALARPPDFTCPTEIGPSTFAIGTWSLDSSSGKYFLRDCPAGCTLISPSKAGSEDLQECRACFSPSQYILQPTDDCQTCPPGLICDGGPQVTPAINESTWVRNGSVYLLVACPSGYQVQASSLTTQQCTPCGKGEECTVMPCVTCFGCQAGFYKSESSILPCQPCPADTYGTIVGGQDVNTACNRCPAESGTKNRIGQTSITSCTCNPGYYLDTINTSQTRGTCLSCPLGATCPGGVSPLFGEVLTLVISIAISTSEYCCNPGTEERIIAALAGSLGVDSAALNIQSPCTNVQCGTRKGQRAHLSIQSAEIADVLKYLINPYKKSLETNFGNSFIRQQNSQAKGMQLEFFAVVSQSTNSANSSYFSQAFSALTNISMNVISSKSSGSLDSAGQIYGPVDSQGQYHLLGCRQGYILANETVATQSCIACTTGTYSMNPTDGCSADWVCPQRSACNQCPAGATCSGLSSFEPSVRGSIWVPILDLATRITTQRLTSCPPGPEIRVCVAGLSLIEIESFAFSAGHSLINKTSTGDFSSQIQECKACQSGQYIIYPDLDTCANCPRGIRCKIWKQLPTNKF